MGKIGTYVRTGHAGALFTKYYKEVESKIKNERKFLDSKHKRICETILENGEHFWKPVVAKSASDYQKLIQLYIKESEKEMEKVDKFLALAKIKKAS